MSPRILLFALLAGLGSGGPSITAQGRYAAVTADDVKALQLNHYFTPDNKSHVPDFTWSFCSSDFAIKRGADAIPADLISKLLPAGAAASEIRGKWNLSGEGSNQLVLTDIRAGEIVGNKEVKLSIYRTGPTVIRIGEPQYVFARRPDEPLPPPLPTKVTLRSVYTAPGVAIGTDGKLAYAITLEADVNSKGEGRGKFTLDMSAPEYDEFGDLINGRETDNKTVRTKPILGMQTLDCSIEFVKRGFIGRVNRPSPEQSIYRIKGPKLAGGLSYVTTGPGLTSGKLVIAGKDGLNEFVIDLIKPEPIGERHVEPCHPGCFPATTMVQTPSGPRAIECIRTGDVITSVDAEGKPGQGKVESVFCTTNNLVEVRTEHGGATTTGAQPFALAAGGFCKAEELKAGDRIWQWRSGKRAEAKVREVVATGRTDKVFNLVVGDSVTFIAGDFVVRGKPPALPLP